MKEYLLFRRGSRGCFIGLISVLLAICAMALSVKHQVPEHPSCGGMLGGGFPVIFLCDDWGGGSPTNSWGKITSVDIVNGGIRPVGFLIDLLFYFVLFYILILIMLGIYQRVISTQRRV